MTPQPNALRAHILVQIIVLAIMIAAICPMLMTVAMIPPLTFAPDSLLVTGWAVCPAGTEAKVIRNPVFRGGYSFDVECIDAQGNVVLTANDWPLLLYMAITSSVCCAVAYVPTAILGFFVAQRVTHSKTI